MKWFRSFVLGHALAKAMIIGVLSLLGNVAAGAYVFEITSVGPAGHQLLDWSLSDESPAFWVLVGILLVMGAYGWAVASYERIEARRVEKALTDADVRAKAYAVLVDPLLESVKRDIEKGKLWSMDQVFTHLSVKRDDTR